MHDPFEVKVDSYLAEWLDPYLELIASSVLQTDRDARRKRVMSVFGTCLVQ